MLKQFQDDWRMIRMGNDVQRDVINDMEFMIGELHKEWEQSRAIKETVTITVADLAEIKDRIKEAIVVRKVEAEREDVLFKDAIRLTRENFVLLRLIKKIMKVEELNKKMGDMREMKVRLDKEEYEVFGKVRE